MSPRTGRPKIDNPKSVQVTARLQAETVEKLEECAEALKITKAEVIRKGIEIIHQGIKK